MAEDPVSPRRQRRRRRAVWRPGEGISRSAEPAREAGDAQKGTPPRAPDHAVPGPANGRQAPGPASGGSEPAPARQPPRRRRGESGERGLRELVGAGPSQLGPARAMRARDANRPSDEDLAQAEQDVVIERRHWKPPKS